jgi:hypothetical protein
MGLFTLKKRPSPEMEMPANFKDLPFSAQMTLMTLTFVSVAQKHKLPDKTISDVVGAGLVLVGHASMEEGAALIFHNNEALLRTLSETDLRAQYARLQRLKQAVHEKIEVFTKITRPIFELDNRS